MARAKATLTEGPMTGRLLMFALPLLAGSLVQQLYNTVDLIFVGNFIDKSASAAIGSSSLLSVCLVNFFGGMSVGSGVAISRIFGAGNLKRLDRAVHNTAALCLACGLLVMLLGWIFSPTYLRLIRTPEEIRLLALGYMRIYFLSVLSIVTYNFGSGILRALGDSHSQLTAQIFGGLMNVAMDYLFIRVFDNGINGVAWATLISQTVAAAIIVWKLIKLNPIYALHPRKIAFERSILKDVINIGVPAGAQALVITLSNVMAQVHINSFGENAIAAFTAYFKVELVIYLPIVALGQAIMTFSGQNMGAGNWDRVRGGTLRCALFSMALAAATSVAALHFGPQLFRLFNKEAEVITIGCSLIAVTFPFYFLYSILQILGDSMRGLGKSKTPMLIILVNICIIRTTLLFLIVPKVQDIRGVAVAYPITWALTAGCMLFYYIRFHRDHIREENRAAKEDTQ